MRHATDAAMVASRALVAIAARSMTHLDDVTLPQFRALVILASHGPITSGELASHLGVHGSTVTRLVDRLVAKRLVARSTPDDRREVVLSVDAAGLAALDAVTVARRRELAVVMRRLSPAQRKSAVKAFTVFAEAAGELPDDQWSVVLNPPLTPR